VDADSTSVGENMAINNRLVRRASIESRIYILRGLKVMLDTDLAELYGVTTGNLNKAAQRNRNRFPHDFMFQLTQAEVAGLRFQTGSASEERAGSMPFQTGSAYKRNVRFLPYAFTQEGIAMLSGVLRSKRAVAVNVEIMRAFVRMRGLLASQAELAAKLAKLEKKFGKHDKEIQTIFQVLKQLITPPEKPTREIGFHARPE
jgi:hypothetical protein